MPGPPCSFVFWPPISLTEWVSLTFVMTPTPSVGFHVIENTGGGLFGGFDLSWDAVNICDAYSFMLFQVKYMTLKLFMKPDMKAFNCVKVRYVLYESGSYIKEAFLININRNFLCLLSWQLWEVVYSLKIRLQSFFFFFVQTFIYLVSSSVSILYKDKRVCA